MVKICHLILGGFLLVALAASSLAAQVDLGTVRLGADTLSPSFTSLLVRTNLRVVAEGAAADASLAVRVTAETIPANLRLETILQRSGSAFYVANLEGQTGAPIPVGSPSAVVSTSGAISAQANRVLGLVLPTLLALLAVSFRLPLHTCIVLVAFSAIVCLPTSLAPIATEVDLELRVPVGFQFDNVAINIVDGTVTSTGSFSVSTADVALCGNSRNTISLTGLTARRQLNVCAGGQITVSSLRQATSTLIANFTSETGAVSVSYAGSYVGAWSAQTQSGSVTATGGDCANQQLSGSCRASLYPDSKTEVRAALGVTLNFGVAACSASWNSDPEYEFVAPSSPELSPSRPTESTTYNSVSSWRVLGGWGANMSAATITSNGFSVPIPTWFTQVIHLYPTFYGNFRAGFQYTFSFRPRIFRTGGTNRNVAIASVQLFAANDPTWVDSWKLDQPIFESNIRPTIFATGPNVTSFASPVSATLTSTVDRNRVRLIAQITLSAPVQDSVQNVEFLDIQLQRQSEAWVEPTLVSGASEKVTIPKMPSQLDPNPRTASDCPHLKAGLRHWHDASIWPGNTVPAPSSSITLPANMSVLISSCSLAAGDYNYIRIPQNSELIFADSPINLRVRNILVEGKLFMGSPTCRLNAPITVTFVGNRVTTDEIGTGMGAKGIGVTSVGSIDVHGYQFHPTWTRLAASINAGDNRIYLQDSVNWVIGQKVVVATSIMRDYEEDQNEVVTIVAIREGGRVIEVEPAFKFIHYGGAEYQSEVGLLSRRIIFQGDSVSDTARFGGHVMVMGQGRFSGVQFYKMGQQNMLARYPVHWHLIGRAPTSFANDNSFWDGFYRCISIHATHETTVLRNVAWNTAGHCYYLEEGVEENNTISFNLAMHIRCIGSVLGGGGQRGELWAEDANALLPADRAAAGFYITNAYNTFVGNAASGGWAGFSFPNLPTPLGFNRNSPFSPERRTTKVFDGNTVHSSGYHFVGDGGCMYIGGLLYYENNVLMYDNGRFSRFTSRDTRRTAGYTEPEWMRFTNIKAWLCQLSLSHWGERADVVNAEVHDSLRSIQLFGESWFSNALINARSNSPLGLPAYSTVRGFQFYDTFVKTMLTDVEFRNFQPRVGASFDDQHGVIISMTHSDRFKPQGISATARISFTNVDRSIRVLHPLTNTGSGRYYNFVDWDGSLVGANGPRIVGSAHEGDWWNFDPACIKETSWNVWVCPKTGNREIGNLEIRVPIDVTNPITGSGLVPFITGWDGLEYPPDDRYKIGNMTLFGPGIPQGRKTTITRNPGITGVTNMGWYMWLSTGMPRYMKISTYVIPRGGFIMFAVRYPTTCSLDVWVSHDWLNDGTTRWRETTAASSFADVLNGDGTRTFRSAEFLFIKMVVFRGPYQSAGEPNPADSAFERGGVRIFNVYTPQAYNIRATCSGSTPDFIEVSDLEPVGFWN